MNIIYSREMPNTKIVLKNILIFLNNFIHIYNVSYSDSLPISPEHSASQTTHILLLPLKNTTDWSPIGAT